MKHVKKKFVKAEKVSKEVTAILEGHGSIASIMPLEISKSLDQYSANIQTEDNEIIQGFTYKDSDKLFVIPEPNPIIIYFETARHSSMRIPAEREKVFTEIDQVYQTRDNFYTFYSTASITAIFLFNTIEAFMNSLIPDSYKYERHLEQKTEILDRFQIQRFVPFEEKIKKVIPKIMGKAFHLEFAHKHESIAKLKEFRDAIMHSKSDDGFPPRYFKNLYTTSLDFNYNETLQHVRDFLNFYETDLIEECPCGKDF